jgi:putative ABC transport system permease protein
MLLTHLITALRSLRRRPGYTALNLVGLAVGMACCLLIGLYVQNELSYDRFHPESERIVRIVQHTDDGGMASIGDGIMPILQHEIPQVEQSVQVIRSYSDEKIAHKRANSVTRFEESGLAFVDSTFFDVFAGFELRRGNPSTVLQKPGSVVLTPETARRYFGDANPMGKTLVREDADDQVLTVTGVLEPVPSNSHLQFDFVTSMGTFFAGNGRPADFQSDSFWYPMAWTYARLQPGVDRAAVEQQITEAVASRRRAEVAAKYAPTLQPISSIHLYSNLSGDPQGRGSITQIYVFGAIALFVLLIAAVNFVNLATARAAERATEVGVRKSIGAQRDQLIGQFLGESVLLSVGGAAGGLLLTQAALPVFTALLGKGLAVGLWSNGLLWAGTVLIILVTGLGAGSYPAFVLSGFRPASIFRNRPRSGRSHSAWLRKGLVVFQFTISVALIVATAVAYSQLNYLRTARLGFDEEQLVTMDVSGDTYPTLKQELAALPDVKSVSGASVTPGLQRGGNFRYEINGRRPDDQKKRLNIQWVDFGFFETLGVETVAGRTPSSQRPGDLGDAFSPNENHASTYYRDMALVVNRAVLDRFGWSADEALGREIRLYILENETIYQDYEGEVVGVVEDYHTTSLREEIPPVVYTPAELRAPDGSTGGYWVSSMLVKVAPGNATNVMDALRSVWTEVLPDDPFQASFLDDQLQAQYQAEQRLGWIVALFSGLAIFVACLGLFGLATYTTQQRTKEIGIRKAVGASTRSIVGLLSREFLYLVGVAVVLGIPLAYLAAQRWLQDFAYHVDLGPAPFVIAAGGAFAIAGLTVSYHALRAARTDPAVALRDE